MGWFSKKDRDQPEPMDSLEPAAGGAPDLLADDSVALEPVVERLAEEHRARIAAALAALEADGVDLDDLPSLGAGYDRSATAWLAEPESSRPDHAPIVERYALGIGEHLDRHTDLDWQIVTDVFGKDLALAEGFKGKFVVVPSNLVAVRWMRRETGWIPGVVGHLVRRRTER